jgi:hypothetical protein
MLYKLRDESNQREINDAAQNDTGYEKKERRNGFSRGKIGFVLDARTCASLRSPWTRAGTTRSLAWPKELN